ncbi:MAG: FkbM family methyltransferase [Myxococcota bacterium]
MRPTPASRAGAPALRLGALRACGDSERGLRHEHALLVQLRERAAVATLDLPGAGEIRMFLNPDDRTITPKILFDGVWEPKETHWFTRSVGPGDTVVDVGANVGYYTLLAARLVGDAGRVFAFEPDPVSFGVLERNVRLNGLSNVVLEQKAVSDAAGSIRLYIAPNNKGDHRIYQPEEAARREYVDVDAVALDDYLAGHPGPVDFVKIDTQGAEVAILEGMPRTLRENPDLRMVIEFWPSGVAGLGASAERLLAILDAGGFRLFDLAGRLRAPPRETDAATLLARYDLTNRRSTNLLLMKQGGLPAPR